MLNFLPVYMCLIFTHNKLKHCNVLKPHISVPTNANIVTIGTLQVHVEKLLQIDKTQYLLPNKITI